MTIQSDSFIHDVIWGAWSTKLQITLRLGSSNHDKNVYKSEKAEYSKNFFSKSCIYFSLAQFSKRKLQYSNFNNKFAMHKIHVGSCNI